jgi:hypothetical protein
MLIEAFVIFFRVCVRVTDQLLKAQMDNPNDDGLGGFKYDVAISFQGKDEALATEIADLLQDRFSTFIYSKKQDELAGRDGEGVSG